MNTGKIRTITSAKSYMPTVLLLDDQDVALTIHLALIKKLNPKIKTVLFKDPKEALEWLKLKHADLIITDYIMEGMNGIEFMKAAKLTKHGASIPFVVVTVSNDKEVYAKLDELGVYRIFTKPININALLDTCRILLSIADPKLIMPS